MSRRLRGIVHTAAAFATDWPVCALAFLVSLPPRGLLWMARVLRVSHWYGRSKRRAQGLAVPSVIVCIATFLGGCNARPYVTDERLDKGLVVILPGIEGPGPLNASIRRGFYNGGVPYALEIYNWHKYRLGASYAFNEQASRKRAAEIVERVEAYRAERPGRPVFVIGHSAGGAMAVFAAEAMPEGRPLDGIIVLAPALSPEYELSRALAGCAGRFLNCYSRNDIFLRTLTSIGCNFAGKRGKTAGQEGFRAAVCAEVRQLEWDESMRKSGNWGGHRGWASSRWVAGTLAPLMLGWAGDAGYAESGPPAAPAGPVARSPQVP